MVQFLIIALWGAVFLIAFKFVRSIIVARRQGQWEKSFGAEGARRLSSVAMRGSGQAIDAEIDALENEQRQRAVLRRPPAVHGSAHWASRQEADADHLLKHASLQDNAGFLPFGVFMEPDDNIPDTMLQVLWNGKGHALTVCPSRKGKGITQVIPTLLTYPGSVLVIDPKGENYELTAEYRRELGPVFRLDPFGEWTDCFNPLHFVKDGDDARVIADLLLPPAEVESEAGEHFRSAAVNLVSTVMLHMVRTLPAEARTISELRQLLALPATSEVEGEKSLFDELIDEMAKSDDVQVRHGAEGWLKAHAKTRGNVYTSLDTKLATFDSPGMTRLTKRSDFDFEILKNAPATIYLTLPINKLDAYYPFLRLMVGSALEAMYRRLGEKSVPVLFLLDEFATLKHMPKVVSALSNIAGFGVRLWMFFQNVAQIAEHYPKTGGAILAETEIKTFYGTQDHETARLISEYLGDRTVAWESFSSGINAGHASQMGLQGIGGGSSSAGSTSGTSVQLQGRPLLTPDEVLKGLKDRSPSKICMAPAITFVDGLKVKTMRVPYFKQTRLAVRVPGSGVALGKV